jgi:hypothetical protein
MSLVATSFAIAKDRQQVTWALLCLTAVSIAVSFAESLWAHVRLFRDQRFDNRIAARRSAEMRVLVGRFGPFVGHSRCDNIHAIAGSQIPGCPNLAELFHKEAPLPLDVLNGMWIHVSKELGAPQRDFASLSRLSESLAWLLHTYNYHVIQVVFDRASRQIRPLVDDATRSALESCRERYCRLLDDYSQFTDSVNCSTRTNKLILPVFPRCGPL